MSESSRAARTYVRFSLKQRIEHWAVMVVFTLLCLTGLPQKFYASGVSHDLVNAFGGVVMIRQVHRYCGLIFTALFLLHVGSALVQLVRRKTKLFSIVPARRDFEDAVKMIRYYLGLEKEHARFDRFDFRQKFEYWGVIFGAIIMVLTGFLLMYPTVLTSVLPGQLIPAAKEAHSNEGLMAMLVIVIWHIYNAHLNPDVFPFDTTMFTGKISHERMEKEHPLELERLLAEEAARSPPPPAPRTGT